MAFAFPMYPLLVILYYFLAKVKYAERNAGFCMVYLCIFLEYLQVTYNISKLWLEVVAMSSFGEILSELRKDKEITQKKLSDIFHVSVGTISNYENNIHFPDIEKLMEMADYFGVTTDYLLGRCESDLSPDVFQETFVPGRTVGSFIKSIRSLRADRRNALNLILSDMEIRATIDRCDERSSR